MPRNSFEWEGNHPALDFVNTLDERLSGRPLDRLASYGALLAFGAAAGLWTSPLAAAPRATPRRRQEAAALRQALTLREALYRVLMAGFHRAYPSAADLCTVAGAIGRAHAERTLRAGRRGLEPAWRRPSDPRRPLWELSLCAEDLLLHRGRERVRKCAAADCGTLFVDRSKAGRRRWCSMGNCGNRAKVRRFRRAA